MTQPQKPVEPVESGKQRGIPGGPPPGPPLFMVPPQEKVKNGVAGGRCYGCHVQCGMHVHLENGKVVRVEGEPYFRNIGALCAKAHAGVQKLYGPDRLNYPMKRTQPKGAADPGWVRISWEEALETITARIKEVQEKHGSRSVAVGQGTGRFSTELNFRLASSLGTPNMIGPANMCRGPMASTTCLTVGHHLRGDYDQSRCMVFWGRNEAWGHASFNAPHIMNNLVDRHAGLIVVDPRFEHPLAHKADIYLPVRPGSDGALMLSWLHVIFEEELHDRDFVINHTNGAFLVRSDTGELLLESHLKEDTDESAFLPYPQSIEKRAARPRCLVWDTSTGSAVFADSPGVTPELFGEHVVEGITCRTVLEILRERAAEFPPEKAAEICWSGSAEKIRQAARLYAKSESSATDLGSFGIQGLEGGHTNTFQTLRTLACLSAVTGNINRPGGDCGRPHWRWVNGEWKRHGGRRSMTPWGAPDDHPSIMKEGSFPDEPAMNEYPLQPGLPSMIDCFRAMKSGEPYPIKAYILIQGNPLGGWCEDQATVYEGLKSLDFMVNMDLHLTPAGHLADILLPAGLGPYERGRHPVIDPLYERWSDERFYIELGRRLSPDWWPWENEEAYWQWLDRINGENNGAAVAAGFQVERGLAAVDLDYYKKADPETGSPIGFPTPTGRIELYSVIAKQHGIEPIPFYEEPAQSPLSSSETAKEYPLVLTTGARLPVYYHSEHRSSPSQRELFPHPEMEIHPDTAGKYGLRSGDWAWIETKTGKIRMKVNATPGILPNVVSMAHGWWQGCKPLELPGYGWDGANANLLVAGDAYDEALGVPPVRSQCCKVYPATEPPFSWESPWYGNGIPTELGGEGFSDPNAHKED